MRTWQVERRKRTRHLIELGGLVVKARVVDLTGDDRAIIFAALDSRQAQKQSRQTGASALGRKGKGVIRCGTGDRWANHLAGNAAGSGITESGRRGDSKYRSAARHHAAWCRPTYNTHGPLGATA
jgi:hypothetical protein